MDEIEVKKQQLINEMFVLDRWNNWINSLGSIKKTET